jgi:hypothetical protein
MVTKIFRLTLILVFCVLLAGEVGAQGRKVTKVAEKKKQLQGEVVYLSKDYISIVYSRDKAIENEILLPIDKNLKLEHLRSLANLKIGDTVAVQFMETTEQDEQGNRKKIRTGTVVTFIRPAQKKPETTVLDSEEAGE